MFANFHSSGISPKRNDLLKIWVREGAICHAVEVGMEFRQAQKPWLSLALGVFLQLESSVVSWRSKCSDVEGEDDITEERLTGFSSSLLKTDVK